MIPVIIGGGAIGAKVISDFWQADKYSSEARNVNYEAFTMIEAASRKLRSQYEKIEGTMFKLANRKKGIMSGTLPKFVAIHEKIVQINFDKRPAIDVKTLALRPEDLNLMNQMISVSGVQMSDREIVGTLLFSAEHGGLIGGLGGLLIGGPAAVIGAVFTGISGAIKKDAKINLDIAYTRSDEAEVIAHNTDTARIALENIDNKANDFLKLITQINALLLKSIQHTSKIIDSNGFDAEYYNDADIDDIMNCCNFAKALSDMLKAPLFDSNGKISGQIDKTLSTGNDYIKKIQSVR